MQALIAGQTGSRCLHQSWRISTSKEEQALYVIAAFSKTLTHYIHALLRAELEEESLVPGYTLNIYYHVAEPIACMYMYLGISCTLLYRVARTHGDLVRTQYY